MATLTGVIFDYSCVLLHKPDQRLLKNLQQLLQAIKSHNLKLIFFSTHAQPINDKLEQMGFPPADLVITEKDVGKKKGSPEWIYETARRLKTESHNLLMIGDDERDWRSAINSATVYIYAKWAASVPKSVTAIVTDDPHGVWRFISHYLLTPPRWGYSFDLPEIDLHVRSLLGSNVKLPATKTDLQHSPSHFTLQDIFTYNAKVEVGPYKAQDLLMLHAITSLYLEGFISPSSYFAVYPSSTPGKISPLIKEFLKPVSKIFHGYFKEDLLIRAKQAVDSSLEKRNAKREGREPNIPDTNQINTVQLHPSYMGKLDNRTIIVFDDFTTTGKSLEWARNLLMKAGAGQIVLLTIGKYPMPYTLHELKPGMFINPFYCGSYTFNELFTVSQIDLTRNTGNEAVIRKSFNKWLTKEPYPV